MKSNVINSVLSVTVVFLSVNFISCSYNNKSKSTDQDSIEVVNSTSKESSEDNSKLFEPYELNDVNAYNLLHDLKLPRSLRNNISRFIDDFNQEYINSIDDNEYNEFLNKFGVTIDEFIKHYKLFFLKQFIDKSKNNKYLIRGFIKTYITDFDRSLDFNDKSYRMFNPNYNLGEYYDMIGRIDTDCKIFPASTSNYTFKDYITTLNILNSTFYYVESPDYYDEYRFIGIDSSTNDYVFESVEDGSELRFKQVKL